MVAHMRIVGVTIVAMALFGCATTQPPAAAATSNDPSCLTDTGSRVAMGPGPCRGFGRSYSNQDIQRTGKTSAADALSLLDSSVTVHH
jgi:hypothetical protein